MNCDALVSNLNLTVSHEALRALLGERLGGGIAREVYELAFADDLVIKFEQGAQSFQNVLEWEIWRDVAGTKWQRWFAPCVEISPCGAVLIQKRAKPLRDGFLPKSLPSFFSDIKPENFGMVGRQVVAVDYALTYLNRDALRRARMRRTPRKEWEW